MKILVLNSGSSSLKFKLFLMNESDETIIAQGLIEAIGNAESNCQMHGVDLPELSQKKTMKNHAEAIRLLFKWLGEQSEIDAIGHRFVHGGEKFSAPVKITSENLEDLKVLNSLAPLHNPHNFAGYQAAAQTFPSLPHIAVFDTVFHSTIPQENFMYGLPYRFYEQYGIRRYGFHGSSHQYIAESLPKLLQRDAKEINAISLHLGNGCSSCAISGGKSMDTSMGFTPLEGLMMGTRCGDLDPSVPLRLMELESLTTAETSDLLNKQSGLLGVSGISQDLREVIRAADDGNDRAEWAINIFCTRVAKSIGSLLPALKWKLDALVFTGGIGENSAIIRAEILDQLNGLKINYIKKQNDEVLITESKNIATEGSQSEILIVKANEEIIIARETNKMS